MKLIQAAMLAGALVFSAGAIAQHDEPRDDSHHQDFHRDYERGHRMPDRFRGDDHVIVEHDYGRYHLRQPPRGYHWVRGDNGDFLLVAVTTGIISSIIAGQQ